MTRKNLAQSIIAKKAAAAEETKAIDAALQVVHGSGGVTEPVVRRSGQTSNLSARIDRDLHRTAKIYCVSHDISVQDFVETAIESFLRSKGSL